MSAVAKVQVTAPRPSAQVIAITTLVMAVGIAFNILRLEINLDHRALSASFVAFAVLGLAAAIGGRALNLSRVSIGWTRPELLPTIAGGGLVASVLVGAALATASVVRVPSLNQLLAGLALFGLAIAPAEELLFRGVLYGCVCRQAGAFWAVVLTAIAFAMIHVPVYGIGSLPLAVSAGLLLGWLRWWTRSLFVPIAVHGIADLALTWL
jgi:membrane protease YdiL (CAAX protease family)